MAIPQATIDQILDRLDIVDIIGQRVKLKKTGRTYSGCCPFHQEKTPSFHVYRDKGYYHCFGCQANGNAIRFLMDIDNRPFIEVLKDLAQQSGVELPKDNTEHKKIAYSKKPVSQPQPKQHQLHQQLHQQPIHRIAAHQPTDSSAQNTVSDSTQADMLEGTLNSLVPAPTGFDGHFLDLEHASALADFDDVGDVGDFEFIMGSGVSGQVDERFDLPQLHQANQPAIVAEQGNLYDLLEHICQYYQQQLKKSLTAQQYFEQRGLTQATVDAWRLGYAPSDWQHLERVFAADIDGLNMLGLIRYSEQGRSFSLLRERVIFPIRDSKGRVVGFGGRALNNDIKPKYINSPDSEVFHKNRLLYGLYESDKAKAQHWLMVEGYMDVIALHQAGISGAVATLGTASNAEHLNILFKRNPELTLAFDGDGAGQKAAWRTLQIALPLLQDERKLRFFVLPEAHDPDSLIATYGVQRFRQFMQQAPLLSDYLFQMLTREVAVHTPEGKSQVMAQLRELTQQMPNGSYKYVLQQDFKQRLGFGYTSKKNAKNTPDVPMFDGLQGQDFEGISHVTLMTAFLLHYPHLFPRFKPLLHTLSQHDTMFGHLLNFFEQHFDDLPDNPNLCRFFVLGGCFNIQAQLLDALQRIDLSGLQMQSPQYLEQHAQSLSYFLHSKLIRQQMTQTTDLKQQLQLKQQLNTIEAQLKNLPLLD